ncbi:hypothetical protein Cgig2_006263 [Carnegiea gigantea]|uniref:Aminotransferase-like plant mobile domain-containing protein n=1 Tax=Carnegiea gigantea TaxID=171969 RepID=A0A9Q1GJI9_9CARY|nr:hypothetical protein Cgig2_006263 [Carnegiea gigantea]
MANLSVTTEGELTAFLAFWLSRFVLHSGKEVIRPEIFRISLAPMELGYIYHGLREAASHRDHLGKASIIFPSHYIIGWLAESCPCLYGPREHSECPGDFPTLICYAGLLCSKLSLPQARHVFRDKRYHSFRARSYHEESHNNRGVIDMGLPDEDFKFILSIRSSVLPVRVRAELLRFIRALRLQRSVMELTHAHAYLQRQEIGAKFYLSSKIKEIFGVVKTNAKIKESVDMDQVKALSDQDLTYCSEIAHIEGQLNNLSSETSKVKQSSIEAESQLKCSPCSKKREAEQVKAYLVEAGFSKL